MGHPQRAETNKLRETSRKKRAGSKPEFGRFRRAGKVKTGLGGRVREGSGRFRCKGPALVFPLSKVQAASEGPGRFQWVLAGSGRCIRYVDHKQRAPEQDLAGSGGFRGGGRFRRFPVDWAATGLCRNKHVAGGLSVYPSGLQNRNWRVHTGSQRSTQALAGRFQRGPIPADSSSLARGTCRAK